MSIINEALKKAQKDLKRKDAQVSVETQTWVQPPAPQAAAAAVFASPSPGQKKKGWRTVILWEILALAVIGAVLFVLQPRIFDALEEGNIPASAAAAGPAAAQAQASTVPASAPIVRVVRPPKNAMVLNGIMKIENRWMALINDEIYEEGDYIKNKRIDKISSEGVTLVEGKRTIFLSARHKKTPN